jgi:hypothetical protein
MRKLGSLLTNRFIVMVVYYGHDRRGGIPILIFVGAMAVFALVLLGFPQTSSGPSGTASTPLFFSYDPNAYNGPSYWYRLNMEGNQCGGTRNSPIIISTTDSCEENENGDYTFQVIRIIGARPHTFRIPIFLIRFTFIVIYSLDPARLVILCTDLTM